MIKKKLNSLFDKFRKAIFLFIEKNFTYYTLKDPKFTMSRYIDLVVNKNIYAIGKIKLPLLILMPIFERLMSEYAELSGNTKVSEKMALIERMNIYVKKFDILKLCGSILYIDKNNQDVIDFLARSNIKGDNILKKIKSELVMYERKYKDLQSQVKEIESETDKNDVSLSDYERVFQILKKNGYDANINMSVISFIEALKLHKKDVEENNKAIEKLKAKK